MFKMLLWETGFQLRITGNTLVFFFSFFFIFLFEKYKQKLTSDGIQFRIKDELTDNSC